MWVSIMLYTANVNKFLWYVVIPFLVILYLTFRVYEWIILPDEKLSANAETHVENISSNVNLDCLVLGGSNAFFSLSAELLSDELNANCYNLSLLLEGFSSENYWEFVRHTLNESQREKMQTIFYSSISPLREGTIEKWNPKLFGNTGRFSFKLIGRPVAFYFKRWLLEGSASEGKVNYPLPNSFGDFNFNLFECDASSITISFEREKDYELVNQWMMQQLEIMRETFPNAKIYFVSPSEFYGASYNQPSFAASALVFEKSINEYKVSNHDDNVFLIVQQPFPEKNLICDGIHHANHIGRIYRTTNLVEVLNRTK